MEYHDAPVTTVTLPGGITYSIRRFASGGSEETYESVVWDGGYDEWRPGRVESHGSGEPSERSDEPLTEKEARRMAFSWMASAILNCAEDNATADDRRLAEATAKMLEAMD